MTLVRPEGAPDTFIWDIASPVSWTCPYCNRPTTVTSNDVETDHHVHGKPTSDGSLCFQVSIVVCPNKDCKRTTATMLLREWRVVPTVGSGPGKVLQVWALMPESSARSFEPRFLILSSRTIRRHALS